MSNTALTKASITEQKTVICRFENEKERCKVTGHREVCNGSCRSIPQFEIVSPSQPAAARPQLSDTIVWKHLIPGTSRQQPRDLAKIAINVDAEVNVTTPLWAVMHQKVTYNQYYPTQKQFANAILRFFRKTIPSEWKVFRDQFSDNFRVITHEKVRVLG